MIFRQICNILPIAMGLSVSVSVSVTIVRAGHTFMKTKNVKITFADFDIYHRMVFAKIVIDILFKVTILKSLK